jgi:hypothetical protein
MERRRSSKRLLWFGTLANRLPKEPSPTKRTVMRGASTGGY